MGKLKLFTCLLLSCVISHAQELNINQYLKSALDDGYYLSFTNQQTLLQNKNTYSLPWINKVQALYQDNQFNNFITRYTLRFYPSNPFQIQRNKNYFQGYQVLKGMEQKLVLKELMRNRYERVVDYWMASEVAGILFEQKKIREQLSVTMQQLAGSTQFQANEFVNLQLSLLEKEAEWQEQLLERDIAQSKILTNTNQANFSLSGIDLITVDQINQSVDALGKPDRTEFNFLKQRAEVSDLKMKLERSNFDIGYIQTMYGADRRLGRENAIGLAFGVALPIINPNKEDIAREKLATVERKGELERFAQQENAAAFHAKNNLKLHLAHYQKVDSLIHSLKEKKLNVVATLSANYDPIIELKYQEKLIQLDLLKIRIKKEIILQYIQFLDSQDKLHERPLVNYLSSGLIGIE